MACAVTFIEPLEKTRQFFVVYTHSRIDHIDDEHAIALRRSHDDRAARWSELHRVLNEIYQNPFDAPGTHYHRGQILRDLDVDGQVRLVALRPHPGDTGIDQGGRATGSIVQHQAT